MKYLMQQYSRTNPGYQTIEHQAVIRTIRENYDGLLDDNGKLRLRRLLISRLQMNKNANQYAKFLGLYRLPNIENWTMSQTAKEYEYCTFRNYFNKIARSRIFNEEKIGPYYRKPAQYLAAAMAIAAYSEGDVEAAIKKIWQARNDKKLDDQITLDLKESVRYSQSVSSIKSLIQGSRRKPQKRRPALSDIEWR